MTSDHSPLILQCVSSTVDYVEQLKQLSLAGIKLLDSYNQLITSAEILAAIAALKQSVTEIFEATNAAASQVKHDVELDFLSDKATDIRSTFNNDSKQKSLVQNLCHIFEVHEECQRAIMSHLSSFKLTVQPTAASNSLSEASTSSVITSSTSATQTNSAATAHAQTHSPTKVKSQGSQATESPKRVHKHIASFFSKLVKPSSSSSVSSSNSSSSLFYVDFDDPDPTATLTPTSVTKAQEKTQPALPQGTPTMAAGSTAAVTSTTGTATTNSTGAATVTGDASGILAIDTTQQLPLQNVAPSTSTAAVASDGAAAQGALPAASLDPDVSEEQLEAVIKLLSGPIITTQALNRFPNPPPSSAHHSAAAMQNQRSAMQQQNLPLLHLKHHGMRNQSQQHPPRPTSQHQQHNQMQRPPAQHPATPATGQPGMMPHGSVLPGAVRQPAPEGYAGGAGGAPGAQPPTSYPTHSPHTHAPVPTGVAGIPTHVPPPLLGPPYNTPPPPLPHHPPPPTHLTAQAQQQHTIVDPSKPHRSSKTQSWPSPQPSHRDALLQSMSNNDTRNNTNYNAQQQQLSSADIDLSTNNKPPATSNALGSNASNNNIGSVTASKAMHGIHQQQSSSDSAASASNLAGAASYGNQAYQYNNDAGGDTLWSATPGASQNNDGWPDQSHLPYNITVNSRKSDSAVWGNYGSDITSYKDAWMYGSQASRRRHSSGEDSFHIGSSHTHQHAQGKSVDDLMVNATGLHIHTPVSTSSDGPHSAGPHGVGAQMLGAHPHSVGMHPSGASTLPGAAPTPGQQHATASKWSTLGAEPALPPVPAAGGATYDEAGHWGATTDTTWPVHDQ